jgi:flagellar biogenesis protein FliO
MIPLHATNLINQMIYEKENAVDIMLSFDEPYQGKVIQKKDGEDTILILNNTHIDKKATIDIDSPIVQKLQLLPYKKQLFIQLSSRDGFQVDASKTVDLYGLRLRVKPIHIESIDTPDLDEEISQIETKKEDGVEGAYLKMMLVLFTLMASLYLLKKWMDKRSQGINTNWLFNTPTSKEKNNIKIIHQRAIDIKNRVALIGYGEKEYLVLLGNTNILLDSFSEKTGENGGDFESVLSQNQEDLSHFIKKKKFDAYKEEISRD